MSVDNNNETFDYEDNTYPSLESSFSRSIKFNILISCQIPSIICNLIIFFYFTRLRELQTKRHHHAVICLLICNFLIITMELPITLVYLYFGEHIPSSYSLCLYWIYINYLLFASSVWMMAIASIQRYIFIFYKHFMKSYLKHYIPIFLPPILLSIWYFVLIFFYPCQQQFDYTQLWCFGACYLYDEMIGTIDWIVSSFIPIVLTVIFNIILLLRVIYRKYKMKRGNTWRTTRKLSIQLFSISFLFLSIYLPLIIFGLIRTWIDPYFLYVFTMTYLAYVAYFVSLLMPFICLISLPEIVTKIKRLCCLNNRVEPIQQQQIAMTLITRRNIQQT
ncbi:unnamed protein product [Adineta steineri]|uniref:G-protein coupled receptors family 1 profile domain-containing protein n=1 Tax=Adineta steineri TaxID=433720 RepID=A0A814LLQ0_9BILA|nr:unnamed protein product [Adineta steineri]CAF1067558.1 unnamed protein product [Adineta steineri]